MAGAIELSRNRDVLRNAIVDAVSSWPELHRRIFVRSHYRGEAVDAIARSLVLDPLEVRLILEHCDRRLRAALRPLREAGGDPAPALARACSVKGCYP